jgi:hypothetical protein
VPSEATAFRTSLVDRLLTAVTASAIVEAVFEGGSAATGRLDEFSDIDWVMVAPLEHAADLFQAVERAADTVSPIVHRWKVDPVGFAEMAQRLYLLRDAPPYFMLDCAVVSRDGLKPFLERERHGEPVVYLDRAGIVRPRSIDQGHWAAKRAHRVDQLRGLVPIFDALVAKELARGRGIEAAGFYQTLVRALIETIGIAERPDRFDFGWRYLERELSPESQRLIESFAVVAGPGALNDKRSAVVAELQRRLATMPS